MAHRGLLRWALLCVAATSGALLAVRAEASQTVVIGPGDSVDSLARKHGVSVRDICRANGITRETLLRDGRTLVIPDPPKSVVSAPTIKKTAQVTGNRVAVRRGPFEAYRRVTLLDHGVDLTVTHKAGDWYQVSLPDGTSGWIRQDFLSVEGQEPMRVARSRTSPEARLASEQREPVRRVARRTTSTRYAEARRTRTRLYVRARSARPEAAPPAASSDVIRTAYAYRGTRYRFGGSSVRGFDCSGFTSYVYGKKGVSLPHSAAAQFSKGQRVTRDKLKPGDLVFFTTTRRGISHVGIYAGDGKFVHASSGGGSVRVDSLNSGYYNARFRGARRVK